MTGSATHQCVRHLTVIFFHEAPRLPKFAKRRREAMHIRKLSLCTLALLAATAYAQTKPPLVDLEMMTWPELKAAIDQGKTLALVYNGGTGNPRAAATSPGGHTLMAHATVIAIAEKLGNAIAAPVLPFSPNSANANLPGTIGLTAPLFAAINEQVAEQLIKNGFKTVVLMGDHGGGQKEFSDTAKKLWTMGMRRKASTSTSAAMSTPRPTAISTNTLPTTASRSVRTREFRIHRK